MRGRRPAAHLQERGVREWCQWLRPTSGVSTQDLKAAAHLKNNKIKHTQKAFGIVSLTEGLYILSSGLTWFLEHYKSACFSFPLRLSRARIPVHCLSQAVVLLRPISSCALSRNKWLIHYGSLAALQIGVWAVLALVSHTHVHLVSNDFPLMGRHMWKE